MGRCAAIVLAAMSAALISLSANAQPAAGPGGAGMGPGPRAGAPKDCAQARDPARCEAMQKAREACRDKRGADRRDCMAAQMPPADCGKARNPQRCAATQAAREACRDKAGPAHRQCMREQLSAPAPAKK